MIGHLGARVSALLDGQLSAEEADEAWAHVYACHLCRDRVEREGWVKSQLAGLSGDPDAVPDDLKGALRNLTPGERFAADPNASAYALTGRPAHSTGRRAIAVVGGGAAGAAMLGVLALGLAPASTPMERRPPAGGVSQSSTPTPSPMPVGVSQSPTERATPSGRATRFRNVPAAAPQ